VAEALKSFLLGFGLFAVTEGVWLAFGAIRGSGSRWVMEPTPGIITTIVIHFVAAIAFAVVARPRLGGLAAFAGGVLVGLVFMLFLVGPGNLWPFVIFIDFVLISPGLVVGLASGALIAEY
jgi:hypothetical protein